MLTITSIDIQTPHEHDYVIQRNYSADSNIWIIMCFLNECMIQTKSGLQKAVSGDCFIKSPDFIEYTYTPEEQQEGFVNDWLHIESADMADLAAKMDLPVNEIFSTGQPLFLRAYLREILSEKSRRLDFYEEKIDHIVRNMLIGIAREIRRQNSGDLGKYRADLEKLRAAMQNDLQENWNIAKMADWLNLSPSYFSHIYRKQFGISPIGDLIQMRLEAAKILLLNTDMGLRDIAEACGFENEFYFSKLFRRRLNISPGIYRKHVR
ncbi:MAG: helix-turn-helix transcriptional regulator [Candidatus Merdivicinus sp.]|jgi:AraC-like DNA-binding protein